MLYPEGLARRRWLERYAEVFDTVELNTTFYRLTKPEVVREWVNRTPEGFVFAAKASRYLIHVKRLTDLDRGVRHASWFADEVYDLLRRHGAALVIADHPERPFQSYELTADWTLLRFHHGTRGRRGNYSDSELDAWAQRIAGWRSALEVFAYFSNDWEGFAIRNATGLRRRLTG
ncbi:DUF72 domain-containing protein [soil metagenome]